MLRYEYEDAYKRIVFVKPSEVVTIEQCHLSEMTEFSTVTLSNGVRVVVPRSPDAFAAEVEKALCTVELFDSGETTTQQLMIGDEPL